MSEYLPWIVYGVVALAIFALWAISFRHMVKTGETDRQRLERRNKETK